MTRVNLREQFGDIDIYLFDQLLKGRLVSGMSLLDAGCGEGRNLVYFLRNGFDVYAADRSETAIEAVRSMAAQLSPDVPAEQFRVEPIEKMSWANDSFDAVICNAVLHFADNETHFQHMVSELWRVLKPGGILFVRTASSIGLESKVQSTGGGKHRLPDGTERYLTNEEQLLKMTEKLYATLLDPIKSVQVQGMRCMTTWCLKKPHIVFFD